MTTPTTLSRHIATLGSVLNTKRTPMFAVTLSHRPSAPLFRLATRAASEAQAITDAERVYVSVLADIVGDNDLRGEERYLVHDAALTQVQRGARESEGWRVQYLVRFAAGVRQAVTGDQLLRSQAEALLEEVIGADPELLTALTSGATIEPCPYQDWARSTGWITIDCAFRTTDNCGHVRDLRPISSAMREATRLIVLDILSSCPETIHVPLARRGALSRLVLQSATLRASRKGLGLCVPNKLIDWLRVRGHHELAHTVRDVLQH